MKKLRGYCEASKQRIAVMSEERLNSFIQQVPPALLRHALQPYPVPHGFRPGQPKTTKKQIEQFVYGLLHREVQLKRIPIYQIMEIIWRQYGNAVLKLDDELRRYSDLVDASQVDSPEIGGLQETDIEFIDSVIAHADAMVSSEEFLTYLDFAPFSIDDDTRARIISNLPSEIAVKRERKIDEVSEKIDGLEAQLHEVRTHIDFDEDRIDTLESKLDALESTDQRLESTQSKLLQVEQDIEAQNARLEDLTLSIAAHSETLDALLEQARTARELIESISAQLVGIDNRLIQVADKQSKVEEDVVLLSNSRAPTPLPSTVSESGSGSRIRTEKLSPSQEASSSKELIDSLKSTWTALGIRKSWSDVVSLILLTCLRSGAILLVRGELRNYYAYALGRPIAGVLQALSIPVGAIEPVDDFAPPPDMGQGILVRMLESVNLSQGDLAIPRVLESVRLALMRDGPPNNPTLTIGTVGRGGLFVDLDPQLSFMAIEIDADIVPFVSLDGGATPTLLHDSCLRELVLPAKGPKIPEEYEEFFGSDLGGAFRRLALQRIYEDMAYIAELIGVEGSDSLLEDVFFSSVCVPRSLAIGRTLSEIRERASTCLGDHVLSHRMARRVFEEAK